MPELIASEDLARWGARAGDEVQRRENERAGHTLCGNCGGTGNELYAMYRPCSECSGGIVVRYGERRAVVRAYLLRRETRRQKKARRGPRDWKLETYWRLSRWFGVGQCFGGYEECHRCGCPAGDNDYEMRRVRPFRVECLCSETCDEMAKEANRA
jgi:hypothetical protein